MKEISDTYIILFYYFRSVLIAIATTVIMENNSKIIVIVTFIIIFQNFKNHWNFPNTFTNFTIFIIVIIINFKNCCYWTIILTYFYFTKDYSLTSWLSSFLKAFKILFLVLEFVWIIKIFLNSFFQIMVEFIFSTHCQRKFIYYLYWTIIIKIIVIFLFKSIFF